MDLSDVWQNIKDFLYNISNEQAALNFAIPDPIYQGLDILTNVVGYIMPLKLYMPIITLVLGYWLLMITAYFVRWSFNAVTSIASAFARFGK